MTRFKKEVEIDFEEIESQEADTWFANLGLKSNEIDNLTLMIEVDIELSEFGDDKVVDRYNQIMGGNWAERAYRYLAEGNVEAAMDEMHQHLGLAPPSHERAIADLLTMGRA